MAHGQAALGMQGHVQQPPRPPPADPAYDFPLSDYFISTSHNTYMATESQLAGDASLAAYAEALRMGCRCLEMDVWDPNHGAQRLDFANVMSEKETDAVVYHGHTLVSRLGFKRVLETIAVHAWANNDFPIILDLENHCSAEVRNIMARDLYEVFGSALAPPLPPHMQRGPLPSPNQLRRRVIIMMDKPNPADQCPALDNLVFLWKERSSGPPAAAEGRRADTVWNASEGEVLKMISPPNALLACMACGVDTNAGQRLVEANRYALTRVFPGGHRIDSKNFDPWPFWASGCSLVALNMQRAGKATEIQEALFAKGGSCGFVLKPPHLRQGGGTLAARPAGMGRASLGPGAPGRARVALRVLEARQVASSKISMNDMNKVVNRDADDLYVAVQIYYLADDGARATSSMVAKNTKTIWNELRNPVWNELLDFDVPSLEYAVVRFVLLDQDHGVKDDYISSSALFLGALAAGQAPPGAPPGFRPPPGAPNVQRIALYEDKGKGRVLYELLVDVGVQHGGFF
eukprot:tig00021582_g22630.t1